MAFPILGHHDALQVGMLIEADAKQIEDLALEEIRAWPDGHQRVAGVPAGDLYLQPADLLGIENS